MIGFNCVGVFYDRNMDISAAYAGSPDFVTDIFRRSLDPEIVPVAVYERMQDGFVSFFEVSYRQDEGSEKVMLEHGLNMPPYRFSWKDLSLMSWSDILCLLSKGEDIEWEKCPLYAERIAYEQSRIDVGE